jgi:putative CocE/NonD family hydrolase
MGEMIGDVSYGPTASRWLLDSTDLHLRFFDDVRTGKPDGALPVRVFVMGENRWRDEPDWPPPGTADRRLYLRADGALTCEPPTAGEQPDTYAYDPADPVPTLGGQTLLPGHEISIMLGQRDQAALERRPDVLVYTSEPLTEPLEVSGRVALVLHAASSAVDTDWTAALVDVRPDGRAVGVVDGILRARYRDGFDRPALLEPDRAYEFTVEVGDTCVVFLPGHRVRLQVSSSNFPRFDRNPNSGVHPAEARDGDLTPARQTVFHDAARASFLVLPVRDH